MRNFYLSLGLSLTLAAPAAYAQTPTWTGGAQTINPAPTNDTGAQGFGIVADAAGNAYVGGAVQSGAGSGAVGTRAFGSTSLSTFGPSYSSAYVAKLSPTQQWLWATGVRFTGEGSGIQRVALSAAGDVYAAGSATDDPFISPNGGSILTVGTFNYTTTGAGTLFLTRLNASGVPQWLVGVPNATASRISWDATAGNLVVVGSYTGSLSLGSTALPAAPKGGVFVARLSAAGQWVSAVGVALTGTTTTSALTVYAGATGALGQTAVSFDITGGQVVLGSSTIVSTGSTNRKIILAQLSAAGQWQWAIQPTTGLYVTNAMEYERNNNLWLLGDGDAASTLQLGPDQVFNGYEFVTRVASAGNFNSVAKLTTTIGTTPSQGRTLSLAVDGQNQAVIAGRLTAGTTTLFSDMYKVTPLVAGTTNRNYVARLNGALVWDYQQLAPLPGTITGGIPAPSYDFTAAALDGAGNLLTTGSLAGTLTLGSTVLTSSRYTDAYVGKLANAGIATAVRQVAGVAPLAVYPNPTAAGAAATLRLPQPTTTAQALTLHDALGRTVRQATIPAGRQEVSVSTAGLAPGLYMLQAGLSRAQLVVE